MCHSSGAIDVGGGFDGGGVMWELSVLSAKFCYKPKPALKNKSL